MNKNISRFLPTGLIVSSFVLTLASGLVAESKKPSLPSTYAPVKDLKSQVDYFLGRIKRDLQDQADYGEEQQGRVAKDASTLSAIALVLAMHDKKHSLKKAGPGMIEAAEELVENADDFQKAKQAFAKLQAAIAKPSSSEKIEWGPVTDLQLLMQQVPIVNNNLRRGVNGRRFKRLVERNAGLATTLAAIAQASLVDTAYCSDEEEEATWQKICAEMRDAAAEVNRAVRKQDQVMAKVALAKLVKSCDDCHHSFRD